MKKYILFILCLAINNVHGMSREEFRRLLKDHSGNLAIFSYIVCGASLATNVTLHTIVKKLKRYKKRSANPKKAQRWITILSGTNKGALVLTCASGIIGTAFLVNTIYTECKKINDASKASKEEDSDNFVDLTNLKIEDSDDVPLKGLSKEAQKKTSIDVAEPENELTNQELILLRIVHKKYNNPKYPLFTPEEENECNQKFEKMKQEKNYREKHTNKPGIYTKKLWKKYNLQDGLGKRAQAYNQQYCFIRSIIFVTNCKKRPNEIQTKYGREMIFNDGKHLEQWNKPLYDEIVHIFDNNGKLSKNAIDQIENSPSAQKIFDGSITDI